MSLWERASQHVTPAVLAVWGGFFVLLVGVLLWGDDSMPWRLGQRVDRDITARVPFEVEDRSSTEKEKRAARDAAPDVYALNDKAVARIVSSIEQLLETAADTKPTARPAVTLTPEAAARLQEFAADSAGREAFDALAKKMGNALPLLFIANQPGESLRNHDHRPPKSVLRREGQPDIEVETEKLISITSEQEVERAVQQLAGEIFPAELQTAVTEMVLRTILGRGSSDGRTIALYDFDQFATRRKMQEAEEAIPPVMLRYAARDPIVEVGKISVLTHRELALLRQEHESFLLAQQTDPVLRQQWLLAQFGMVGLVLLVVLGLLTYTSIYHQKVFRRPLRTVGLCALMLVMVLLSRLVEWAQHPHDLPTEFTVAFVVCAAALLTISYDQRLAIGAALSLAVLSTLASRGDLGLFLTTFAASAVTVYMLHDIRTRSKVILAGSAAAVAAFVASASMGLIGGQDLTFTLVHATAAAGAALGAGFLVQGILPNFERLFGVATSMTLLEWADASRPLLRRLAQEAPGTYSHSVILSQMAEEAAEAIGANGLLARVGALYHDIGKITKSEYFVENQESRINRHDRLSPTMSLLIIVGHVKDGVEMARAYRLPRVLIPFIAEHHGTTVVKYFHHQATEAAKASGRSPREVPESEFRYPGPKPRSKETAILMLCDGCEGAVRALGEPTPGRIESTVHQVTMDRLIDGQFDDCEITLRELRLIEQSLVKSLAAVHHGRIKYPKAVSNDDRRQVLARPEARPAAEVARQA